MEVEVDDSDEEEECEGDDIPTIKIPQELKEKLRKPWRKTLIIKILGKTVAYKTLISRVTNLWKLEGEFECIDLGYGFYAIKFQNMVDRAKVIELRTVWKIKRSLLLIGKSIVNHRIKINKKGKKIIVQTSYLVRFSYPGRVKSIKMASTSGSFSMEESRPIGVPPHFNGTNSSLEEKVKKWSNQERKEAQQNTKAMHMLCCAIDPNVYKGVSSCSSAKEMWDKLEEIYGDKEEPIKVMSLLALTEPKMCGSNGDEDDDIQDALATHEKGMGNIYMVHLDSIDMTNLCLVAKDEHDSWLWHKRLGHASMSVLQRLIQDMKLENHHQRKKRKNEETHDPLENPTIEEREVSYPREYNYVKDGEIIEPKNIKEALNDEHWIMAMQEELNQFERSRVWTLVERPSNKSTVGTRCVFRNKLDESGNIVRNKARLVAQGISKLMQSEFEMSMMGELSFFLGLQIKQRKDDIFINQAKFQSCPKESHLLAVKRIFRYLKDTPSLGLWYPRDSSFSLHAFSDADYGGCKLDRKSTSGDISFPISLTMSNPKRPRSSSSRSHQNRPPAPRPQNPSNIHLSLISTCFNMPENRRDELYSRYMNSFQSYCIREERIPSLQAMIKLEFEYLSILHRWKFDKLFSLQPIVFHQLVRIFYSNAVCIQNTTQCDDEGLFNEKEDVEYPYLPNASVSTVRSHHDRFLHLMISWWFRPSAGRALFDIINIIPSKHVETLPYGCLLSNLFIKLGLDVSLDNPIPLQNPINITSLKKSDWKLDENTGLWSFRPGKQTPGASSSRAAPSSSRAPPPPPAPDADDGPELQRLMRDIDEEREMRDRMDALNLEVRAHYPPPPDPPME
ncbi:hypothetical protein F3Y22_tig00110391pilonHSYRG00023 [Hibiscus syriacus]|uniref:DUF4283 domain-containing protein n=1 Tax=Hibiscus syriacus TaxID=106335 RepID=A0A6A3AUP4_HIBSY|nr:hypothetical protein F3Y22_tig00110391pilonHSYRG00023 [Hibiscus syriacus]